MERVQTPISLQKWNLDPSGSVSEETVSWWSGSTVECLQRSGCRTKEGLSQTIAKMSYSNTIEGLYSDIVRTLYEEVTLPLPLFLFFLLFVFYAKYTGSLSHIANVLLVYGLSPLV